MTRLRRTPRLLAFTVAAGLLATIAGMGSASSGATQSRDAAPTAARARQQARPAAIKGQGSTYVGLAMNQWKAAAQSRGLNINYLPNGSPAGLGAYASGTVDFAGTEAEFRSLSVQQDVRRGYQYVPDVGGAVAIMYNLDDSAGRQVNYLHLSRATVAKIFTGEITRWSDRQISAENKGFKFPDQPIRVVYRAGQSGTTALFYDFVANADPASFRKWATRTRQNTQNRIIQVDAGGEPYPNGIGFNGSDQIASYVKNTKWTIGYDEFGYAKTYKTQVAWIDNSGGKWTQPYAENIAAALTRATLRDDLSQELSRVYTNPDPRTYPISAYSYLVTQCQGGGRATCRGPYRNAGVTETLRQWMRYIACDGQVAMARIGYSPLPENLSQEIINSIHRMTNNPADRVTLNAGNCANPRFRGSLGPGSVNPNCDPYECGNVQRPPSLGGGGEATDPGGGSGAGGGGAGGGGAAGQGGAGAGGLEPGADRGDGADSGVGGTDGSGGSGGGADEGATTPEEQAAQELLEEQAAQQQAAEQARQGGAGRVGATASVGGGSNISRSAAPEPYDGDGSPGLGMWPLLILVIVLAGPVVFGMIMRKRGGFTDPTAPP